MTQFHLPHPCFGGAFNLPPSCKKVPGVLGSLWPYNGSRSLICLSFLLAQLTPEEEEKRRVRRERNKLAAAKCRNRRRELTDRLQAVSFSTNRGVS